MTRVLIDRFMPEFDVSEHFMARVQAPAEVTYTAARRLDLLRSSRIRGLLTVRGLPGAVRRRRRSPLPATMTLDDLSASGFVWLADEPPAELVLGIVGAFWRPAVSPQRVEAAEFESFREPGLAKAAWNFCVIALDDASSVVVTETRVLVPDGVSRRKFLLYWAAVGPFSGVVRKQALGLIRADAEGRGSDAG